MFGKIVYRCLLAASLAISAGTMVLWIRSYGVIDCVGVYRQSLCVMVQSGKGLFVFQVTRPPIPTAFRAPRSTYRTLPLDDSAAVRHWYGKSFRWWHHYNQDTFCFPMWLVLLALCPLWIWTLIQPVRLRRSRRKRGLCVSCGYDLTGNVSGRCPECGERVPA
jgi:hypothetical protein